MRIGVRPLRDLNRRDQKQPHGLAVLVFVLSNALKKLRVHAAQSTEGHQPLELFRAMSRCEISDNFMEEGGTELAPMSCTADLSVPLRYSQGPAGSMSVLFWIHTQNFMDRGVDLEWCSAFPHDREFVYPPLCYIKPIDERPIVVIIGDILYQIVRVKILI